jgi:hypothetical protein
MEVQMNIRGKLETAANAATIVAALLLSAVLVKVYLFPRRTPLRASGGKAIAVGAKLNTAFPGVDWRKNGQTIVLAISTQCHFCTESAPFFRTLSSKAGSKIRIVALLPQPVGTAQEYLSKEGVRVDQVKQVALSTIGVVGTPTMLLVDSGGTVTKIWEGELRGQEQALATLGL